MERSYRSHLYYIPLLVFLIGLAGVLYYTYVQYQNTARTTINDLETALEASEHVLSARDARITELEDMLTETQTLLQTTLDEKNEISSDLEAEKDRNDAFERQIEKIGSTVGTLDKLAKIDPELLMKYSKVYFLNEHYMPAKLVEIPSEFVHRTNGDPEFIEAHVAGYLSDMLTAAREDGIELRVLSAFRSFDEQRELKGAYTVSYGSGANIFSADQGYSEHQLGTTVDFTTQELEGGLAGFDATPAYTWLTENAHKYGFVLSYPKDNAFYIFEPWHWRFVGTDLARDLHRDDAYFYDLDQRKIDEYLITLFD